MLRRFWYFFLISPPTFTFAGYLANWKMLDPRKLMPLSMQDCNAPIAVITEITEKTPIVMPIIVNAARSLFAPKDASAILMISLNNIVKSEIRNPKFETNWKIPNSNALLGLSDNCAED